MIIEKISDEQVFSLVKQLPPDKKRELLNHLLFDQWPEVPRDPELHQAYGNGRKVMTREEVADKLKKLGRISEM